MTQTKKLEPINETIKITQNAYDILLEKSEELENLKDFIIAQNILNDIANGKDELIPFEMVLRLDKGEEHPIRIWRNHRHMKAKELAELAVIPASHLSAIENGSREAGLKVIKKIAAALSVKIDDLIPHEG